MRHTATLFFLLLSFSFAAVTACDGDGATDPDETTEAEPALTQLSGDGQLGAVGTDLLDDFVVEVRDAEGAAMAGAPVSWTVVDGGGTLSTASTTTNSEGRASVAYRLGDQAGENLVRATSSAVPGAQVDFQAEGLVPNALATLAGQGQSGRITQPLAAALQVQVTASDDRGVPGVTVEWTVPLGDAEVSSGSSVSNENGVAAVGLTLGSAPGADTVMASVPTFGLGSVEFVAMATQAVSVVVEMEDIAFNAPGGGDDVAVQLGDTIRWVNLDGVDHTATSQTVPTGGAGFDSGLLDTGQEFEFVPQTRGQWIYFCEVHPTIMVDARITVN